MTTRRAKAVALFSGGLDSTLAILVMRSHGVEVEAIKFLTHFGCDIKDSSSCGSDPYAASEQFGFSVKLCHLGQKFVDIVKNPRYGYGKNMNPCIDCRLLMIQEARDYMEMTGADFIITGEVLAQRPMSQMRDTLNRIETAANIDGRLVRPLSGRLLAPTRPELDGLIEREWLLDIAGRSRRRQMELAKQFGLEKYPNAGGGCWLTERIYSNKLRDLLAYTESPDFNDINLLKLGRHFRLAHNLKLIVGHNQAENQAIMQYVKPDDHVLEAIGVASPMGILRGVAEQSLLPLAASMIARYSDARNQALATVAVRGNSAPEQLLEVAPAGNEVLERYRVI
jgi:tRNA-uridine 2-sulfurtransferase